MTTILSHSKEKSYSDLDLNFIIHPIKKDINKFTNEMAILNAVKHIILTNHYEKPFTPDYGCNVRKLLFENLDIITASALEREIEFAIKNFEPRVSLSAVQVKPDVENNAFRVDLIVEIINQSDNITISFSLEKLR